jgi:uncharacterized protein YdiU (UPF0061 family)
MNVNGESFDYGPWRFLPSYDPDFVAAYFDPSGLYAFGRQAEAVRWNLAAFAEALTPLAPPEDLRPAYEEFDEVFRSALRERFLERLGLAPRDPIADAALVDAAYAFLEESRVGYDRFFFDWFGGAASAARAAASPEAARYAGAAFDELRRRLDEHAPRAPERLADPYFSRERPCELLIGEVERLWAAIAERDDWGPFERKVDEIRDMGRALGNATASP